MKNMLALAAVVGVIGAAGPVLAQVPGAGWPSVHQPGPAWIPQPGRDPYGMVRPGIPGVPGRQQEEEERRRNQQHLSHLPNAAPHAARHLTDSVGTTRHIEPGMAPIPRHFSPAGTKTVHTLKAISSVKSVKPSGISGWAKGVIVGIVAGVAGLFKLLFGVLGGSRKE